MSSIAVRMLLLDNTCKSFFVTFWLLSSNEESRTNAFVSSVVFKLTSRTLTRFFLLVRRLAKKTQERKPKLNQKASQNFPENPGNHSRGAQGRPRSPLGPPKDPQGTPQQQKGPPKTPKSHPKHPKMIPKGVQGTPLGPKKLLKGIQKGIKKTLQRNQNSNGKSMQKSSRQRLHHRGSQTTLRRK